MSDELDLDVESIQFLTLVATFVTSGMVALGKIPNPATNQIERNLDQAQYSIDILMMLMEKTKGNLSTEEERALKNAIADLQINFLQEKQKDEK